jgi:DnaJ-class molecular chaperone
VDGATDHYATLGLDRKCTPAQIRTAYRLLAKKHHPDVNPDSPDAQARLQIINAANEVLSDPERRAAYDRDLALHERPPQGAGSGGIKRDISHDVFLHVEDFIRGTSLEIKVNDPANPHSPEIHSLIVPEDTAPGTRFRLPRDEPFEGGHVVVRVRARPGHRFKVKGPDLRTDLRISAQRATAGGREMIPGAAGRMVAVQIPPRVARGAIVRVSGEGLPKARGGRGDLLVRIVYRPEVRVTRQGGAPEKKAPLRIDRFRKF